MPFITTVTATINGQTYDLALNAGSGMYEAVITAPSLSSYNQSGHYYPVTVAASDTAGNSTTVTTSDSTVGESLKLQVK
ncbi:MAG: hypothetical protein PUC47_11800, partial [Oscillospiraceae bacterium]|nr:hypothetical protein [Oscillospiraceae bacterium]